MKNKSIINFLLIGSLSTFLMFSCTDLSVNPTDSEFIPEVEGTPQITGAPDLLASNYVDLGSITDQANIYALNAHTSDEMIPPTRGTDWGDNGVWRTLHAHTWDAGHPYVLGSWNLLNERVFKCNRTLAAIDITPEIEAQAKFLRAFYMWQIMDYYGQVPFREVNEGSEIDPMVMTRAQAYDFVLKDLQDALSGLESMGPSTSNTVANKAAANAMLARLLLNKEVYTGTPADYNQIIAYCDAVKADGYDIEEDYYDNFNANDTKEIIFASPEGSPQNRIRMTLHYNQNPDGWNGFATLADFYNKFEDGDIRKEAESPIPAGQDFHGIKLGFLVGQQYEDDGVTEVINGREGIPLAFTPDVPLAGATTFQGIRVMKYHPSDFDQTKYVFFRYADVHLMKAEAQFRGNIGDALATVNELRTARNTSILTSIDEQAILDERGRELYWEGIRRTDLIRFGKFTEAWEEKVSSDASRNIFPIPAIALASNPNLSQNPGY